MKKQPMLRRRSAEVMTAKKEIAEEEATDRRNRLELLLPLWRITRGSYEAERQHALGANLTQCREHQVLVYATLREIAQVA
jgi:hypothetical protein